MPNEPDSSARQIKTVADVVSATETIYQDPLTSTGILHVTAVWRDGNESLLTLKINQDTPRCEHDTLVLSMTRARADAIVTTGRILRSEPHLRLELLGPARVTAALHAWRREILGKAAPPWGLVLTSGRNLDLGHPLLASWARPVIFTSRDGYQRLHPAAAERGIEVIGVDEPSLRGALAWLRDERGARTISVEAGPTTSSRLYETPAVVDEVLLSVFEAPELCHTVRGQPFLSLAVLRQRFAHRSAGFRVATADGSWLFQRFVR